jgi:hypothetical protein
MGWVGAVRSANVAAISRLDSDLARRAADLPKPELDRFTADISANLDRSAATARLESGFGVEPSTYPHKLFFPKGARVAVRSQQLTGEDNAHLLVGVSYPRDVAPVYVTDVQLIWHGPTDASPGTTEPAARPNPAFSSGYFEAGHPFLANPGYRGHELRLFSGMVKTLTLKVDLVRDPKLGWSIADLTPVVSENVYWE